VISHDPSLTNKEVRGVLVSSADDLGETGWDHRYGAGRLNAYKALNLSYPPRVAIEYPSTDYGITQSSLFVVGSAASTFLESYSLYYGIGQNPAEWITIVAPTQRQVVSDTLGKWNIQDLADTSYILRLVVKEWSGRTIEHRIRVFRQRQPPLVTSYQQMDVLAEDKYGVLISLRTESLSEAVIHFRPVGIGSSYQEWKMNGVGRNHFALLTPGQTLPDVEYEYYLEIRSISGLTSRFDDGGRSFTFTRSGKVVPKQNDFTQKSYTLPPSFLLNKVADFDRDGNGEVLLNEYSDGYNFDRMKLFEFRNGGFVQVDSVNRIQIPKDFGDSNGNGRLEVFSQADGKSYLFEQASPDGSPIATVIFADTAKGDFWASQMDDIDGDGKAELIGRNEKGYMVWKNIGGDSYSQVSFMPNPVALGPGESGKQFGPPHSEIADFDGDGKKEVLVG
jgi:hypothetical protein